MWKLSGDVKLLFAIFWLGVAVFFNAVVPANAQVNVTQFHNHESRDGLYIDSVFSQSAAVNLARDLKFDGTIVGNVYAQPLYIENGPGGKAMIIVATESNNVYALDAGNGTIIWQRNVGEPVSADDLVCTKFDPMGITGTPVVDLASRALFLDAMITPDGGTTKKHLILSLNVDTGDINPGWPVDVEATATYNGINFIPSIQQQRPALGIVGNILYVGYGSMSGLQSFSWLARGRPDRQSGQRDSMGRGHQHATAVPYGESAASLAMGRTRLLSLVTPSVPQIGKVEKQ